MVPSLVANAAGEFAGDSLKAGAGIYVFTDAGNLRKMPIVRLHNVSAGLPQIRRKRPSLGGNSHPQRHVILGWFLGSRRWPFSMTPDIPAAIHMLLRRSP